MANTVGARTTVLAGTETRVPRSVDVDISELEPEIGPLITLLVKLEHTKPVQTQKIEWFEHERMTKWATSAAAVGASASSTTITVSDGTQFLVGDMFIVVPAVGVSTKPELIRVQSKSGAVLTVTRNIGAAGLMSIASGDSLYVLGDAQEEYSSIPSMKSNSPSAKYSYLQISRTPIDFSNSAIALAMYGAKDGERKRAHREQMIEHKRKMAAALYWSIASENTTGGEDSYALRTTQGLRNTITTNVVDGGGILTYKKFMEFSRMSFRYGNSTDRLLVAAPKIIEAINAWATSHLMVTPGVKKYGLNIQSVETPHGVWRVVRDWTLEDGVSGKNGFGGMAFSVDIDNIEYCYLKGNGVSRDTKVEMDIVQGGADGKKDQIISEYGFKIKLEKTHGLLYDVTDYMA